MMPDDKDQKKAKQAIMTALRSLIKKIKAAERITRADLDFSIGVEEIPTDVFGMNTIRVPSKERTVKIEIEYLAGE